MHPTDKHSGQISLGLSGHCPHSVNLGVSLAKEGAEVALASLLGKLS